MRTPAVRLCAGLVWLFEHTALRRVGLRNERRDGHFFRAEDHMEHRRAEITEYRRLFAAFCTFQDKVVAELGCSRGYLLDAFRGHERFTAIGIDRDPVALRLGATQYPGIRFVQSTDTTIPLPADSVDIIYTIDTVEHLSRVREILLECHRILRPQGRLLVHFHPWLGPYGSHLQDIIPFPWPHLVFSMATLLATATTRYDSPDYVPYYYGFDPETGARRANPYRDARAWGEYLNHVTIRQFRRIVSGLPFRPVHVATIGFSGRRFPLARHLAGLARVRALDEVFTKAVFCVLEKAGR
jgi:SAM-dependent methyltransferase